MNDQQRPLLERWSWIATIVSMLIGIGGLFYGTTKRQELAEIVKPPPNTTAAAPLNESRSSPFSEPQIVYNGANVVSTRSNGCADPGAILVKERYSLVSDGDLAQFIVAHAHSSGDVYVAKAGVGTVFSVNPTRKGWIYQYCAPRGFAEKFFVRMLNSTSGQQSNLVQVVVDASAAPEDK